MIAKSAAALIIAAAISAGTAGIANATPSTGGDGASGTAGSGTTRVTSYSNNSPGGRQAAIAVQLRHLLTVLHNRSRTP